MKLNEVLVVPNDEHRQKVVQFMLENNISFQSGLDEYDAEDLRAQAAWESSNESEWMGSSSDC